MTDLSNLLYCKMPLAAWVIDIEKSNVTSFNSAAEALLEGSLDNIKLGKRVINEALRKRLSYYLDSKPEGYLLPFNSVLSSKDNIDYTVTASVILLEGRRKGLLMEAHSEQRDPAQIVSSSEEKQNIDFLVRFNSLAVAVFDKHGKSLRASECFFTHFGDVKHVRDLFVVSSAANSFVRRLSEQHYLFQEIRLSSHNRVRWYRIEASQNDVTGNVYLLAHDIQEKRDHEIALYKLKSYDNLTNLPNRNLLYQQLENALVNAQKRGREFGLLYLDLDSFKVINDNFGHRVGDELIMRVAERIKESIPSEACLYRLGGDEFVVVLENTNSIESLERIAESIIETTSHTYPVAKMEMMITASIGIAGYPQHANDIDNLLKNADAAMYRAKSIGHNTYFIYEKDMAENINAHLTLGGGLRKGIEEEQFVLYYQPKVSLPGEKVVGAEALVRWVHPELGFISPDQFIPLAEESGLILPLGEWVIRRACRQMQEWREKGYSPIKISVNLSSRQFMQVDLVDMVSKILDETGVDPAFFELELTESMLMLDAQKSIEKLHGFRKLGLSLSIDDFGTGYSSLAYLKKFPIQALKIDRSFIHDLGLNFDNDAIVKATIAMANSLNLNVIAEGVENRSQVDRLNGYECQEVQGYLFSKPLSDMDFISYIKADNLGEKEHVVTH